MHKIGNNRIFYLIAFQRGGATADWHFLNTPLVTSEALDEDASMIVCILAGTWSTVQFLRIVKCHTGGYTNCTLNS